MPTPATTKSPSSSPVLPPSAEPTDEWRRTWFQNAHSDMRWAKEQGWRALQWILLLLAGMTAAQSQLPALPKALFEALIVLSGVIGAWYLWDLHKFGQSSRDTAEGLVKDVPGRDDYLPRRSKDPHHVRLLIVRLIISLGAAAFGFLIVKNRLS